MTPAKASLFIATDVISIQPDPEIGSRLLIDQSSVSTRQVDGRTELGRSNASPVTFTLARADQESLRLEVLRIVNTRIPILDAFLWRLVFALPYVLLLLFLRREPVSRFTITPALLSLSALLLAFRVGAAIVGLLIDLGVSLGPWTRPVAYHLIQI